jgi:hypothetical protein
MSARSSPVTGTWKVLVLVSALLLPVPSPHDHGGHVVRPGSGATTTWRALAKSAVTWWTRGESSESASTVFDLGVVEETFEFGVGQADAGRNRDHAGLVDRGVSHHETQRLLGSQVERHPVALLHPHADEGAC